MRAALVEDLPSPVIVFFTFVEYGRQEGRPVRAAAFPPEAAAVSPGRRNAGWRTHPCRSGPTRARIRSAWCPETHLNRGTGEGVHPGDAGVQLAGHLEGLLGLTEYGATQAINRGVGELDRLLHSVDHVDHAQGAEGLLGEHASIFRDVGDNRGLEERPGAVLLTPGHQNLRALGDGILVLRLQPVGRRLAGQRADADLRDRSHRPSPWTRKHRCRSGRTARQRPYRRGSLASATRRSGH